MKRLPLRILGWSVVGLAAMAMGVLILNGRLGLRGEASEQQSPKPPPPRADVAVLEVARQKLEITDRYTGMIRPWERYSLAFELPGRLVGFNAAAKAGEAEPPHFDVGMRVRKDQVIARLDRTLMEAALAEAVAELTRTRDNHSRAKQLAETNSITKSELDARKSELDLALARHKSASKNLENTWLRAPANAVISQRMGQPGETVAAHAPVLELLEVDDLLLVLGIPESRISEVKIGQRAYVQLLGRDLFNRPRQAIAGVVHQVAAAADDQTGLFEVEIKISNADGALKPGLIAEGRIVMHEIDGFRLPIDVGVKHDNQWVIYALVDSEDGPIAKAITLTEWVEQGPDLLIPDLPSECRRIVVRGQHRLQDGTAVNVVDDPNPRHDYQPRIELE